MATYKTLLSLSLATAASLQAIALDVTITPGALANILEENKPLTDSSLVIKGQGDVRDLMLLASLPESVKTIDLSQLHITEYSSSSPVFEGRSFFAANQLPCYIFFKAKASDIILPGTLTSIDDGAFAGSEILKITIPEGVITIGDHVFYDCPNLDEFFLPTTLQSLGCWSFARCPKLTYADLLPTAIRMLGERTFTNCSALEEVQLPHTLLYVGKEAFSGTKIHELNLQNVTKTDDYALVGMNCLESVSLNSDANMGQGVLMANRSLKNISGMPVDLPRLFAANCTNLDIDPALHNVSNISDYSLAGTKASTLTLGSSLTSIGNAALSNLSGLKKIDAKALGSNVPDADADAFKGIECSKIPLLVAENSESAWKAHPVWGQFDVVTQVAVGVDPTVASDNVSVVCDKHNLLIIAESPINSVDIYNTNGQLLISSFPYMSQWSADVSGLSDDILVVKVATDSKIYTAKVLRK